MYLQICTDVTYLQFPLKQRHDSSNLSIIDSDALTSELLADLIT
jgi:hypothetical protein